MALEELVFKIKAQFVKLTFFSNLPERKELILLVAKNDELPKQLIVDYNNKKCAFLNAEILAKGDKKQILKILKVYLEYLIRL